MLTACLDDEPDLLVHPTVALLARDLFHMQELEEYALQRLKSQLHGWSASELFEGIEGMYATSTTSSRSSEGRDGDQRICYRSVGGFGNCAWATWRLSLLRDISRETKSWSLNCTVKEPFLTSTPYPGMIMFALSSVRPRAGIIGNA